MVMMEPRNLFFMALTLVPDPNAALVTYKDTNNTFLMKTRKTGSDKKIYIYRERGGQFSQVITFQKKMDHENSLKYSMKVEQIVTNTALFQLDQQAAVQLKKQSSVIPIPTPSLMWPVEQQ